MDYQISTENRGSYLYASVTGSNTVDTIRRYSNDITEACRRLALARVLVVVNLEGPGLSMLDVYKTIAATSDAAASIGIRAAYVDLNPEHRAENMHLAEAIASTRGIPVRTFRDVAAAEAWLLGDK